MNRRRLFIDAGYVAVLCGAALAVIDCDSCQKKPGEVATEGAPLLPSGSASSGAPEGDGGTMNATGISTAAVAALLNPSKLPAYTGPTGSIEGTITVEGDPAPEFKADFSACPDASKTWGHTFREGPELPDGKGRALADAIVVVTGYSGYYVPEKREAVPVTIEGCGYTKRTVTMTFGQRLEVENLSRDYWTPLLEPGPVRVMRVLVPRSDPVRFYPDKPGHWLLTDRERRYAVTDVYAFLHPLHASTDVAGQYRIDGVPVGKLKVGITHPQVGSSKELDVEVRENVVARVDGTLTFRLREAGAPTSSAPSGDAGARDAGPKPKP